MSNKPFLVKIEKGKTYAWCQCAESENQPFCDGSHEKINAKNDNLIESLVEVNMISSKKEGKKLIAKDEKPMIVKAEKDTEVNLCTCKQSKNLPYCNDSRLSI